VLEKQRDIRGAALPVYRRMLLRLNFSEPLHIQLANDLSELLDNRKATSERIDAVVILARQVPEHE
jgi:hypothetical protein